MKKYSQEIVASVFLFLGFYTVSLLTVIPSIVWEIYILLYCIFITLWSVYKKHPVDIFYHLTFVFFAILILISFLNLETMPNNVATIIFELLCFSLIFKFYNQFKKRSK